MFSPGNAPGRKTVLPSRMMPSPVGERGNRRGLDGLRNDLRRSSRCFPRRQEFGEMRFLAGT